MVIFHSYVAVYQRVPQIWCLVFMFSRKKSQIWGTAPFSARTFLFSIVFLVYIPGQWTHSRYAKSVKKKKHHIIHHTTYSKKNHWHHYTSLTLSLGWRVNLHSWLQLAWSSRPVMILQVSPSKSMVDPQRSKQSSFWKLIQNPIKILCLWYLNGLFNQPQL